MGNVCCCDIDRKKTKQSKRKTQIETRLAFWKQRFKKQKKPQKQENREFEGMEIKSSDEVCL